MENFNFTNNWFNDAAKAQWEKLISQIKPKKILEIGSFVNLYSEKINIFSAPLYQIYIKKISD